MCNCGCNKGLFGLDDSTLLIIIILLLLFCNGGCGSWNDNNDSGCGNGCGNGCGCGCSC